MTPRKAVAQELSRERILEEARELFSRYGYNHLTMRTIAKEMGYSHGALYYHFHDKAELFFDLIREDFRLLMNLQRKLLEETQQWNISHLERVMLEFIKFGLDHPYHYEIMFLITDPELNRYSRTEQAQCLELFSTVVRAVVTGSGEDAKSRYYTAPYSLFMSLHGFISYNIQFRQSYNDVDKLAREHVRNLLQGIL